MVYDESGYIEGWLRENRLRLITESVEPTGLLLLQGQITPAALHAIPQRHPEIGLLLGGHALPSLLNVLEGRVRNCCG